MTVAICVSEPQGEERGGQEWRIEEREREGTRKKERSRRERGAGRGRLRTGEEKRRE